MSTSTALHNLNLKPSIFDNKYELNSTVGRGRGSVVYKAYRIPEKGEIYDASSEPVALKVLTGTEKNPEEALKRIKKEARALVTLNHPNIIKAYNYVARPDCCYLSLEYAEYGDLAKVIENSKNKITVKSAIRITRSILRGLDHIHRNKIIHRDLKLENILVVKDLSIKITDFSISLLDKEKNDLNLVNKFVGTIEYVAPECLRGHPYSASSDLYAVGIILYKLLSNNFPFEGHSIHEAIELKARGAFKKLGLDISEEIPSINLFLERVLSPLPENRFASAKQAEEELLKISSVKGHFTEQTIDGYVKPDEIDIQFPMAKGIKIKQYFYRSLILALGAFMIFLGVKSIFYGHLSISNKPFETSSTENTNVERLLAKDLLQKSGLGILESLYTKDKHYRFSILPYENNKALFSLGINSSETTVIDLNLLKEGGPIKIEGKGINLILRPTKRSGNTYEGEFQNLVSGTKGVWRLSAI